MDIPPERQENYDDGEFLSWFGAPPEQEALQVLLRHGQQGDGGLGMPFVTKASADQQALVDRGSP